MGVPPTGNRVEMELIDIMRFDGAGQVCEHWGVADMLSLMQQIGAVPACLAPLVAIPVLGATDTTPAREPYRPSSEMPDVSGGIEAPMDVKRRVCCLRASQGRVTP
jgi:hypothetical protein